MEKRHRCNICGRDFDDGETLRDHLKRRHPKKDVYWWVIADEPGTLPFED